MSQAPSRWTRRRLAVIGVALGTVALGVLGAPRSADPAGPSADAGADVALYEAVRQRLVAGEPYHDVLGAELLARGFAVWPPFHWRFPAHLELLATLPWPWGAQVVFLGLSALAAAVAWAAARPPLGAIAAAFVGIGLIGFAAPSGLLFAETWAGAALALSAAGLLADRPVARVGGGLLALVFRELAAVWCMALTLRAVARGERREALAWVAGGAVYLAAWGVHAARAAARVPDDPPVLGWFAVGGADHVLRAVRWFALADAAPPLAPVLVGATALAAVVPPEETPQVRPIAVVVLVYLAAFAFFGNQGNDYWGCLLAGLWGLTVPPGLLGGWRALRDG